MTEGDITGTDQKEKQLFCICYHRVENKKKGLLVGMASIVDVNWSSKGIWKSALNKKSKDVSLSEKSLWTGEKGIGRCNK